MYYVISLCTCQYRSDARYKARVIYTRLHGTKTHLYTEAIHVYTWFIQGDKLNTRKRTGLPYVYLVSDLYCTYKVHAHCTFIPYIHIRIYMYVNVCVAESEWKFLPDIHVHVQCIHIGTRMIWTTYNWRWQRARESFLSKPLYCGLLLIFSTIQLQFIHEHCINFIMYMYI